MEDFHSEIRRLASLIKRVSKDTTLQDAGDALGALTEKMVKADEAAHDKLQKEAEQRDNRLHADFEKAVEKAQKEVEQAAKKLTSGL